MNFHCRVVNFSIFKVRGSRTHFLELRQHKNDSIQLKKLLSLNLPRFFTHLHCEKKSATILNLATFLTELSLSCIVLALGSTRQKEITPIAFVPCDNTWFTVDSSKMAPFFCQFFGMCAYLQEPCFQKLIFDKNSSSCF